MALPCRWCRNSFLIILIAALHCFYAPAAIASRLFKEAPAGETAVEGVIPVELRLPKEASWGVSGGNIYVTVRLFNRSPREAGICVELLDSEGSVVPGYIYLQPGENRTQKLRVVPGDGEGESEKISIIFRGDTPQTRVEPDLVEITGRSMPLFEALGIWMNPWRRGLRYLLLLGGAAVLLILAVGTALYLFLARPGVLLQGSLYYRKKEDAAGADKLRVKNPSDSYILKEARARKVVLADLEQDRRVTIFMGLPEKVEGAALLFETGGVPYTITLSPAWQSRLIFFLQGWQALFKRPPEAALEIECSRPGIIEVDGVIYSRKIILPGEEFVSGGYRFQYALPVRPAVKEKEGTDLLLEKGMNTWQRLE